MGTNINLTVRETYIVSLKGPHQEGKGSNTLTVPLREPSNMF